MASTGTGAAQATSGGNTTTGSGGETGTTASGNASGGGGGGGKTHEVGMFEDSKGVYFDPIGLYVNPGDTVKWVNRSGAHSATSYTKDNPIYGGPALIPDGAKSWNSGVLSAQGASFSKTFTVEGTYDYYCIPHKSLGMVGRIVCGSPGGPAEQQSIPSSDQPPGVFPSSDVIVKQGSVAFPYVPTTSHGGPPLLFWGGVSAFAVASVYLFAIYDQNTGRYDELATDELDVDGGGGDD